MEQGYEYVGSELEIFAHARNWKTYFSQVVRPYLRGDVVEMGAGLGVNTPFLIQNVDCRSWLCVEPDFENARQLAENILKSRDPRLKTARGTAADLADGSADAIVYIDVLEHIESDQAELELALTKLRPGGSLVVLSPAHAYLYSEFDRSIGHYRRYSKSSLRKISSAGAKLLEIRYFDSVGLLLSLGNRLLLRQSLPTLRQITFWDRVIVPLSRVIDVLTFGMIGKSIVAVWRRD